MMEITDDFQYNMAKEELEDGVRLVLWAQDTKVGYSCGNKLCVSTYPLVGSWWRKMTSTGAQETFCN